MRKRSITLAGHKTSLALEPEFWQALQEISSECNKTLPALIAEIDATRQSKNLSSAVRVHVLSHYRELAREFSTKIIAPANPSADH